MQGESKEFVCPGKNTQLLIFFPGSCTHLFFKQFITEYPKGYFMKFGITMKLKLELYLSLDDVEFKFGIHWGAPVCVQRRAAEMGTGLESDSYKE